MGGLGDVFATKSIKGPILVCYLQFEGRDLYLVGEEHNINGKYENDLENHVIEQMFQYSKHKPITVFSEMTFLQMRERFLSPSPHYYGHSPNATYGYYYWNNSFARGSHKTTIADVRKVAPYDIYTMLVDPAVYCFEHYIQDYDNMLPTVRKWAKQAEKTIINKIRTRASAKAFLESLYMPGMEYPEWYKELYKTVTNREPDDPLKTKMQRLQEQSPSAYNDLVQHMRSYYYGRWGHSPYSVAFERIQSARRTKNSKMVASKKPGARMLFIELTSYLLDLNVILDFLLSEDKHVFVLAGLAHIAAIVSFFDGKAAVHFKFNKDGNIPEGPAIHGIPHLANHMPSLLKDIAGT